MIPENRGMLNRLVRQLKVFAVWLIVSVLVVPVVMMIHEFGHFLPAVVLGFPHVSIHYESTRFAGDGQFWGLIQSGDTAQAAALFSFWKVAVMEIGGPLMSILMLYVAARYARRFWIAAILGTVGLFHFVPTAILVEINFRHSIHGLAPIQHWGLDEFDFSILTGVPVGVIFLCELALIVGGLILVGRAMRKGTRAAAWAGMVCGMRIGVPLYFAIGPHILP